MQRVKALNRFAIVHAIQEYGPISRTALARRTKLSKSTVSTITAELLAQQVIGLHSVGESSGGRPATNLAFEASAGYVIGLDLANDPATILLTDLQAQVHEEVRCAAGAAEPDALLAAVLPGLRTLLAGPRRPVLGVGVACPGKIDTAGGEVVRAGNLHMLQYPLRRKLHDALGCPIYLGNDTDCAALGERHCGQGSESDDLLYVAVGTGIGAGIVVGGELFTGANGFAGEIGHMVVTDSAAPCPCGNRGCLEAVAAGPAIAWAAWERLRGGEPSVLREAVGGRPEACTARAVLAAAAAGDALACDVVATAARLIGRALAALVNAFDIDSVLLGGPLADPGGVLFATAEETTRSLVGAVHRPRLRFLPGQLGARANAIGAAVLVLRDIFTPHGIDRILLPELVDASAV
jgi:predicted NBD/HSP70 family sugar kinase